MTNTTLTPLQVDIIGEIANISMGNSATALSKLVQNLKVDITTPTIELIRKSDSLNDYNDKCVLISINFIKGLTGSNVLILNENDVKVIADLMMFGDGSNTNCEITELHLSAVSEAMNQMMGAASTSLSLMLKREVDISPPKANNIDVESVKLFENLFESPEIDFVKIKFRLQVGNLVDSVMVQLYPIQFAQDLVALFEQK